MGHTAVEPNSPGTPELKYTSFQCVSEALTTPAPLCVDLARPLACMAARSALRPSRASCRWTGSTGQRSMPDRFADAAPAANDAPAQVFAPDATTTAGFGSVVVIGRGITRRGRTGVDDRPRSPGSKQPVIVAKRTHGRTNCLPGTYSVYLIRLIVLYNDRSPSSWIEQQPLGYHSVRSDTLCGHHGIWNTSQ